jgi:hypothetical protein
VEQEGHRRTTIATHVDAVSAHGSPVGAAQAPVRAEQVGPARLRPPLFWDAADAGGALRPTSQARGSYEAVDGTR